MKETKRKRLECRTSYVFHDGFLETLLTLGNDGFVEVMCAIDAYIHGEKYELTGAMQVAFIPLRQAIDRDDMKFWKTCADRSRAGQRSAELRRCAEEAAKSAARSRRGASKAGGKADNGRKNMTENVKNADSIERDEPDGDGEETSAEQENMSEVNMKNMGSDVENPVPEGAENADYDAENAFCEDFSQDNELPEHADNEPVDSHHGQKSCHSAPTKATRVDFVQHRSTKPTEKESERESESEKEKECEMENDLEKVSLSESVCVPGEPDDGDGTPPEEFVLTCENAPAAAGGTAGGRAATADGMATEADGMAVETVGADGMRGTMDYDALMRQFNTRFAGMLPQVRLMTPARCSAVRQRISDCGQASLLTVMANISRSPFLLGHNTHHWHADFDWIFRPSNYVKILEGNYMDDDNKHTINNLGHATDRQDFKQDANQYAFRCFADGRESRAAGGEHMGQQVEKPF